MGEAALQSAEDYIMGACNHFFLLNARNCGYAQVEDLGCAVVCARNCGYARMVRFRMCSGIRKELWLCANGKI